jgi:DNA-directed RNA polymerase specialized sigma24 family protein
MKSRTTTLTATSSTKTNFDEFANLYIQTGDSKWFDKLISAIYKPLKAYVMNSIKDPNNATDITHDIILQVQLKWNDFVEDKRTRPNSKIVNWIWGIARNAINSFLNWGKTYIGMGNVLYTQQKTSPIDWYLKDNDSEDEPQKNDSLTILGVFDIDTELAKPSIFDVITKEHIDLATSDMSELELAIFINFYKSFDDVTKVTYGDLAEKYLGSRDTRAIQKIKNVQQKIKKILKTKLTKIYEETI